MARVTISYRGEFAQIEYHYSRNDKIRYGIEIKEGSLKYCPESFGIEYNPEKDSYSFINDSPKNILDFEARRAILIGILKNDGKEWENIKWEVDPETYMYNIL